MAKINPNIVFRKNFDNTGVLFNPDNGEVFSLNQTGAFIYRQLNENMDNAAIVAALRQACGESVGDNVVAEVESFIDKLREMGFVSE